MQDLLLIMGLAAMGVVGYFVMGKLDDFLEKYYREEHIRPAEVETEDSMCYDKKLKECVSENGREKQKTCAETQETWKQEEKEWKYQSRSLSSHPVYRTKKRQAGAREN